MECCNIQLKFTSSPEIYCNLSQHDNWNRGLVVTTSSSMYSTMTHLKQCINLTSSEFTSLTTDLSYVRHLLLCDVKQRSLVVYIHVTLHRNKFLFKSQTRRTNYPNFFCYKTLHVSDIFSAHYQEFSNVHSTLLSFMLPSRVRMELRSILTLLGSGHQKSAWNLPVPNVQ
jgi:hypothetical protein